MILCLDPDNLIGASDEPQPVGEIPRHVRTFGFAPDLTHLLPGDLILVSARRMDRQDQAIRAYQAERFDGRYSQWTHAAIHIEQGTLVEALPSGVAVGHLYDYVPTHRIIVRRFRQMTMADRLRVALHASLKIGRSYGFAAIASFAASYLSPKARREYLSAKFMICSELFAQSFIYGANRPLTGVPIDGSATPAHLAASPDLTTIAVAWIRLARSAG